MSEDLLATPCVGEAERMVTEEWSAPVMGSGTVPVLATLALVALMEQAAVRALEGRLPAGQTSVGIRIDVRHLATTPIGMGVRAKSSW